MTPGSLLPSLAQAAVIVPLDVGTLVYASVAAFLATLVGVVGWFLSRIVRQQDQRNAAVTTQLEAVSDDVGELKLGLVQLRQEVVGLDGRNGLKGDVRELKREQLAMQRGMRRTTSVVLQLARERGITPDPYPETEEADDDAA